MTITAILTRRGGNYSGTQETSWLEYKVTTTTETIDNELKALSAVFQDHKVRIGAPHPSRPGQRAVRYSVEHLSNHKWWQVRFDFENSGQNGPGNEDPPDVDEIGFTDWNTDTSGKFVRIWRDFGDISPTPGVGTTLPGDYPRVDIGGTKVDAAGEPQDEALVTTNLTIERVVSGLPNLSVYRELANKRNTDDIFGDTVAGRWLYKGCSTTRLDVEKYRETHRFAWDQWFHLRQQPLVQDDGRAKSDGGARPAAETVYWVQPFTEMGAFAVLGLEDPL